jgi:hypothetical protein
VPALKHPEQCGKGRTHASQVPLIIIIIIVIIIIIIIIIITFTFHLHPLGIYIDTGLATVYCMNLLLLLTFIL